MLDVGAWLCCRSVKDGSGDMKIVQIREIIQQ